MRFGMERNIISKQTVMNEAPDGETRKEEEGEEGAGGSTRMFSASSQTT